MRSVKTTDLPTLLFRQTPFWYPNIRDHRFSIARTVVMSMQPEQPERNLMTIRHPATERPGAVGIAARLAILTTLTTTLIFSGSAAAEDAGDPIAPADSVGCAFAPGNPGANHCLTLNASGAYVESTRVSYSSGTPPLNVCRTQARWTSPVGTFYSPYNGGCVFSTAWFDAGVYQNAPGTWCGSMRTNHSSDVYPSPACNEVF